MYTHKQLKDFETRIYSALATLTDWVEAPEISGPARARVLLRKMEFEAAFLRVRNGNFGFCIACGSQIDESELVVNFAVSNCLACSRKRTNGNPVR